MVASPTYTFIPMEIDVDRPAAEVWQRIGGYCDIGEWFGIACTIMSGTEDEFGAVRSVANEVLVGKTELSYTYTQTPREGRPYNLYHGTLEARPVTATSWTLRRSGGRRCPGSGQGAKARVVHEGTREHEDSRRGRHAATSVVGAAHVSGGAASPGCPRCEPVRMRDAVCWNAPGPVKLFDNKQIEGVAPLAQLARATDS